MRKTSLYVLVLAGFLLNVPVSAELIGWWKFDDGSGTTAADSSTRGQNGTLTGGPVWSSAGKYGGCLQFDGTDDYVVATGTFPMPQYTISVWFREDRATGDQRDILSVEGAGNTSGVLLEVGTDGRLRFLHRAPLGTTGGPSIYSPTAPTAAAWHHMAAVKSATEMLIYVDGQMVASQADATTFDAAPTFVYIGVLDTRMMRMWPGLLDDVKIFDTALSAAEVAVAMALPVTGLATNPVPANKATDVQRDVILSWSPGETATAHDVYFGTVSEDVNNASRTAPGVVLVSQNQDANAYDPVGVLQYGQTYYWRIDEANASSTIVKGPVWSFTVEPVLSTVTGITVTASSFTAGSGPETTIDESGLNDLDQHGTERATMWLTAKGTALPAWIQYDLGRVRKLESMTVWNYNGAFEDLIGLSAKGVIVEHSTDGTNWTQMSTVSEFAQGTGLEDYTANTTVDFGGLAVRYVKITITSTWSAAQAGLSEVRFLQTITYAREPQPASGATGIVPGTLLGWRSGRQAASHSVFMGSDPNVLTPAGSTATNSFTPSLDLGTAYYWRVDEVNAAEAISTWTGDVWNFTTASAIAVDDMESYNDSTYSMFDVWIDGYSTPTTNGGVVGLETAANGTFGSTTILHGGKQSMPFSYNNTTAPNSEATRTFEPAQDWTVGGAKTLVIYFRGDPANTTGQLFAKVNGVKVNYSGSAAIQTSIIWKQWNIDLASVAGLNPKAVKSLTIGVSGSGKGILYFDDVSLYKSAPAVAQPTDPGTTGLVACYTMEGDAKDSAGSYTGTLDNVTFADSLAGLGKAAQFNGTNSYVDLGTSFGNLIGSLGSSTFAAWVYYTGSGNVWQRVMDCGNGGATPQVYIMLTTRNAGSLPRFALTTTSTAGEAIATAPAVLSVGWHHLAGVVDASTMKIALYVDGNLAQGNVTTTTLPSALGKTTQNWLGRSQWSSDPYLNGSIDEFRVYNRALSAGEVGYLAGDR